nr:hypothetical protein [uncultured Moellerella sp.]
MNNEIDEKEYLIATIVNEIFTLGNDDGTIYCMRNLLIKCSEINQTTVDSLLDKITNYFDFALNPTEDFLRFIACDSQNSQSNEMKLTIYQKIDDRDLKVLGESPINEAGHDILNAAIIMHDLGMKKNADRLTRIGMKTVLSGAFKDELLLFGNKKIHKAELSKQNRESAAKKRNKYYAISLKIMDETWKKHPTAAINGMNNKILKLIESSGGSEKTVSLSSLERWRKEKGLGPRDLVYPPISFSLVITDETKCILDNLKLES